MSNKSEVYIEIDLDTGKFSIRVTEDIPYTTLEYIVNQMLLDMKSKLTKEEKEDIEVLLN